MVQETKGLQALNDSQFGCTRCFAGKLALFCIDLAENPVKQRDSQQP